MTNVNLSDLEDKVLFCKDCGNKFIWTAGEQKFFLDKGLQNFPKRCKICAQKNKAKIHEKHPVWWAKCQECGKKNEVPFEVTSEDIYCEECFQKAIKKRDEFLKEKGIVVPEQSSSPSE